MSMCSAGERMSEAADVQGPGPLGFGGYVGEVSLRQGADVVPFLDALVEALAGLGYSSRDCLGARLALEEAVVNGLRHGNGGDPARRVCVRYDVRPDALLAEVEDEGPGFDPRAGARPDPAGEPGPALRPRAAADAPLHDLGALLRARQPRHALQAPLGVSCGQAGKSPPAPARTGP
jgi:anti-sigma regulatory factor (Ser/Thr protein kinase)